MSATLSRRGFKVTAIDHSKNRHKQLCQTLCVDLADDSCVQQVATLLDGPDIVVYVHVAPPNKTSSRAKERKVPFFLRRLSAPEPKQLRSDRYPHGLPNLSPADHAKVEIVNKIYQNLVAIIERLPSTVLLTIGGPSKSYMWSTAWFSRLIADKMLFPIHFQQCMHGGDKDKWSTFYTNSPVFSALALVCDKNHTHLPWGIHHSTTGWNFSTKSEEACPQLLCDRIADIIVQHCREQNVLFLNSGKRIKGHLSSKQRAAEAGKQPRGSLLPPVIPEFKEVRYVDNTIQHVGSTPLTSQQCELLSLPFPVKLLPFKKGEHAARNTEVEAGKILKVGIFRTPAEFVDEALQLQHPFDGQAMVSDHAKRAIFLNLTKGRAGMAEIRKEFFDHYTQMAENLQSDESAIHSSLDPQHERILKDKRLLLFKQMCQDAMVEDDGLLELMVSGVKLTGQAEPSGQFETEVKPPALSNVQLMKSSKWTKHRVLAASRTTGNKPDEVQSQIWSGALEEVERGWLSGPYSEAQLADMLGPLYVVSRRFGLQQTDKIRPIDDLSESLINSAYGSAFRLDLPGIDGITLLARTFLEAVRDDGTVQLKLSDGLVLKGVVHKSISVAAARKLVGRTLDLEGAYKQMVIHKSSQWCSVLAVDNGFGAKKLFLAHALPFGASAAVYGFNRVARALHSIGERLLGLVWTNYYDDFPQLCLQDYVDDSQLAAEQLLSLLGWKFSTKFAKRRPFSSNFDALGATFDFSKASERTVIVRNKVTRIQQLTDEVNEVLRSGCLTVSHASSLRGKLQYTETHTFGRALAAHTRTLLNRACGKDRGEEVSDELAKELRWIKIFLKLSKPRLIRAGMSENRAVIFTDACLEDNDQVGGLGMVTFFSTFGKVVNTIFMSEKTPTPLMSVWQLRTPKIISTLELFAAVASVERLASEIQGLRVFLFVDNEAARASLISMYSPIKVHATLLSKLSQIVQDHSIFLWVARVPSPSNPSDEPSRMKTSNLIAKGVARVRVKWPKANEFD